jgi:putrescine importer
MGRNGQGPIGRFFGYLHPSFQTPSYAILFVGAVSLPRSRSTWTSWRR